MKPERVFCSLALALALGLACSPSSDEDPPAKGGRGGAASGGRGGGGGSGGGAGAQTGGRGGSGGMMMTSNGGGGSSGGSAGSGPTVPGNVPSEGLIGRWAFDEGMGTEVKDSSGSRNDGLLVEGLQDSAAAAQSPKWIAGKKGKALEFDGVDDWIRVPRSDSIDTTGAQGAVTLAAWVRFTAFLQPTAASQFNFVVNRQEVGTSHEHYGLALLQGRPTAAVHFFFASAPANIVLNEWTHLAMTYDGIDMSIYVNGVVGATSSIGWNITADTTPVTIGGAQNLDVIKEFVQGEIDEVYLYNRPLVAAEIQALVDDAK